MCAGVYDVVNIVEPKFVLIPADSLSPYLTDPVGKNVVFPLFKNIFSEFFEKLKVSDYHRKSESFRLRREI